LIGESWVDCRWLPHKQRKAHDAKIIRMTQTWQSMKGVVMHYLIQFSKFQIWIWDQRQGKKDIMLMYIFIHDFYQLIAWTTWEENNSLAITWWLCELDHESCGF
jgi:hypothetical protein